MPSKKITILIIALGVLTIGLVWFNRIRTPINKPELIAQTETPLSALTTIDISQTCKLYIVINPESVWIDPFENVCSNINSFSIEKNQYPKLFQQGVASSSFISVEKSKAPGFLIVVSNNQPSHGGYLPVYQLEVNPKTGEIKEL